MTRNTDYREALEYCLDVMRSGGDLQAAVARYPQHAEALRDDVRVAYALRRAAASVRLPVGAEQRGVLRMQEALRSAREEARPARTGGWSGWLRPVALAGVAAALLVAFGLGAMGTNPLGTTSNAEASVEGVVVENTNGTLTLETTQGLTRVDLNQKPTIQDDMARLLSIADLEAGQVVQVEAKKTPDGALVAREVNRRPLDMLQAWCEQNGDACREVQPRLEAASSRCRGTGQPCPEIQRRLTELREGLRELTVRIQHLKARCEAGDSPSCRKLVESCTRHPAVCAELKVRPGQHAPGLPRRPDGPPQPRPLP